MTDQSLSTTNNGGRDFIVFGAAFNADDPDWSLATDDRFEYPDAASLAVARPGVLSSVLQSSTGGATITTGANFYVNGSDLLTGGNAWNLEILDNNKLITPLQ